MKKWKWKIYKWNNIKDDGEQNGSLRGFWKICGEEKEIGGLRECQVSWKIMNEIISINFESYLEMISFTLGFWGK